MWTAPLMTFEMELFSFFTNLKCHFRLIRLIWTKMSWEPQQRILVSVQKFYGDLIILKGAKLHFYLWVEMYSCFDNRCVFFSHAIFLSRFVWWICCHLKNIIRVKYDEESLFFCKLGKLSPYGYYDFRLATKTLLESKTIPITSRCFGAVKKMNPS